ncbi:unnamed protein product [Rotaria sordida]|uniref:G-protein coupled receptors family 1 profile domain-containing protein n=1 Tax=Rotaria sordida TaxID=392033 RepID=A0A814IGA9_9BILA|nr:unnamed protein product [Rotaria sordida]
MYSINIFFHLVFVFGFLSNFYVQSFCNIHDDEILCKPTEFYHYNSSSINNNIIRSGQTLHLTNAYYSGILNENINNLIIDDYPYKTFPLPFISSLTLHNLHIEHTFLNAFPTWLCAYNKNLSFIEINYSHIEEIFEHDLNLCLNLCTLRISNSYLKQFTNSYNIEIYLHSLYLNNNKFLKISNENGLDLNQFRYLRILDLSYNQIQTISSENFNQTLSLTTLDLSFNNLEYFQLNNIKYLILLEILDLRGNNYLHINENWYDYLPHLIKIYFPYAHFCCNYKNNLKILNEKHIKKTKFDQTINEFIDEKEKQYKNENQLMSVSFHSDQVCFPLPDHMTPCESLFSSKFIRFIFLMIVFISVASNLTALIITLFRLIISSYNRWSISTVLSSNLALADFISSIYLVLVGIMDIRFNENFYIKTQLWTNSHLCTLAGFIYIFGIQSSIYALTLLTFERFYTILYSFKRQTPWPPKFTLTFISLGWLISFLIASLPLININNFHANSLCVPFRMETIFDRLYLSLLIIFDICFIGIIITCNGLICFNFSKSYVHTLNDARATLKILTLVIAICISRIPLIIFIFLTLIIHPTYSYNINNYALNFTYIKLIVLFLQPFSSCFNPFMYSSLSTLKWIHTRTEFERPRSIKGSFEFSRFRSTSVVFNCGYHPLRMMSISSLDYRLSSSPNTP